MNTNLNDDDLTLMQMMQVQRDEFVYFATDINGGVTKQLDTASLLLIRKLIKIETLVKKIISSKESTQRLIQRLAPYDIPSTLRYHQNLPNEFEYSEYANLFIASCNELACRNNSLHNTISTHDGLQFSLYDLIEVIRQKSVTPEFKAKLNQRRIDSKRNFVSMSEYTSALFEFKSPLLVLRIDFSYHKEFSKFMSKEEARADMARFLGNRRSNKRLFKGWLGYILKMEYGINKGYHWHALLFFNGSVRQRDVHLSLEIGKYWDEVITKGRGQFFSSNARTDIPEDKYGIGRIHRSDMLKRNNLLNVVGYLTKSEQFIRLAKVGSKDKSITKGEVPIRTSNAGRPRKYVAVTEVLTELLKNSQTSPC